MNREQRAYERLFTGARKPAPEPLLNPAKVMALSDGSQIRFEQKHGVWFWMSHTRSRALFRLADWGDTEHALYHLCRRLKLEWRWL